MCYLEKNKKIHTIWFPPQNLPSYLNPLLYKISQKSVKKMQKSLHHHESKALASEREDSRENWNTVDCRLVSSDCAGWLISSWDEDTGSNGASDQPKSVCVSVCVYK